MAAVDLHWLPLGAGGNGFVRRNGIAYERWVAWREHRPPQALFHAALTAELDGRTYAIEQGWPAPAGDPATRGATVTGPVFFRSADRVRALRYEVRCWQGGAIPDLDHSIGPAQRLTTQPDATAQVIALTARVPATTWGRRAPGDHEMWNSNSAIAWILASAGLDAQHISPPATGRAPGWVAGWEAAHRDDDAETPASEPRARDSQVSEPDASDQTGPLP